MKPNLKLNSSLKSNRHPWTASGSSLALLAFAAHAATNQPAGPAPAKLQTLKPTWLTELSVGIKEGYDDNTLLVSGRGPMAPADSWVTTVTPRVGLNLLPLAGGTHWLQTFSFAYTPDFVSYHNATEESYTAHRLANVIKSKSGEASFSLEHAFNFIDGSHEAATYRGLDANRSAYATATSRERKYQWQDKTKASVRYDWSSLFLRPTLALTYCDFMTNQRTNAGYQNYADRYDLNGGLDLGYKVNPQWALTLGYRYGHQFQQEYPSAIDPAHLSSPSDYQRVLVGLEGKPFKWLTATVQAGPDFRDYADNTPTHTTPVEDPHLVTYYGEGSLTADLSANDSVTVRYRGWQWVASTGKLPYFDSTVGLNYRRKLGKDLSVDLGGSVNYSDYNSAKGASSRRNDWMYVATAGVTYSLSPAAALNVCYNGSFGRNMQENITVGPYREFDQHVVSAGLTFKF